MSAAPRRTARPFTCDLCDRAVSEADVAVTGDGWIIGLIVCPQCIEDNLATAIEPHAEVGMVGGGR